MVSSVYGGYAKASRYSGVRDADLDRALKRYRMTLAGIRSAPYSTSSDTQLRRMATRGVVKRFLLARSNKAAPKNYTGLSIKGLQKYIAGK